MKTAKAVKVMMAGAMLCMACTAVWGARKVKRNTDTGSGSAQTQKAETYTGESKSTPSGSTASKGSLSASPIVEQLNSLAFKLVQDGKGGKKASFAFIALSSDSGTADVENYVTDALTEAVFNTGKIRIIERANLEKILSEQQFQTSGLVNDDTATAIGNIAGVDYVCYGTIKDGGDTLTVSARVVDVESGEICAMSRANVQKDSYLANHSGAGAAKAAKSSGGKAGGSSASKTAGKGGVQSAWIVRKSRNDFDECTVYTFMTPSVGKSNVFFFLGYEKYDDPVRSRVRTGLSWKELSNAGYGERTYNMDIKDASGKITSFDVHISREYRWSSDKGYKSEKGNNFLMTDVKSISVYKQIADILLNNDYLIMRFSDGEPSRHIQTAGLEEALAAEGITVDEIMAAFDSEQF